MATTTQIPDAPPAPPARQASRARIRAPAGGDPAATALLAVVLVACGYAAFAHGAIDLAAEARVQVVLALAGLALAALALGGGRLVPRASPVAWAAVGLLVAFACWCGLSIIWSLAPDLSWQEL